MTRDRWFSDPKAIASAERLYSFIGKYVISIQWLETKIDEVLKLARGYENSSETLNWLTGKRFHEKIDEFRKLVTDDGPFLPIWPDGWLEKFESVVQRLHAERTRRNGLLHSSFLFETLSIDNAVLRTHVVRRDGEPYFDQEWLSSSRCEEILDEVASLSIDFGHIYLQLIAAYDDPNDHAKADITQSS